MQGILSALRLSPEYTALLKRAQSENFASLTGAGAIHRALFSACLAADLKGPSLVLCAEDEVDRMCSDLEALTGQPPVKLQGRDFVFHAAEAASRQYEQMRLGALYQIVTGQCERVVTSPAALMQRTMPPEVLKFSAFRLDENFSGGPEGLVRGLLRCGYTRCLQVEGPGQFAARGGIVDFFSPGAALPVRAEFFGDEVDLMGYFDVSTQRRTENLRSTLVLPACEAMPAMHPGGAEGFADDIEDLLSRVQKRKNPRESLINTLSDDLSRLRDGRSFAVGDRYLSLLYPMATPLDYFDSRWNVILCQRSDLGREADSWEERVGADIDSLLSSGCLAGEMADLSCTRADLDQALGAHRCVCLDSFASAVFSGRADAATVNLLAKQLPSYGGSLDTAVSDIGFYVKNGFAVVVLSGGSQRAANMLSALESRGVKAVMDGELEKIPAAGLVTVSVGGISGGFELTGAKIALITENQLLIRRRKTAPRKKDNRERVRSYADLNPGDLVVHDLHGIGRFVGIETRLLDGKEQDFVKIAYRGTDFLYVPASSLDMVSKYIGAADSEAVSLSKLGGDGWARTKARAKAAAKDLAKELIALYAQRKRAPGHAFPPDDQWQAEFEGSFEFQETDDQLRCTAEIKADMESPCPMDRLLCGDVGFGKTEVALRAVMKCVLDSRQAAILVPTTVLAQQHYLTALRRFSGYPVNVEMVSRFRTPTQIKKTLEAVKNGSVDLLIGTHRLLQKDVEFKNLGLLIIDEEQRFGVSHKERLKEISRQVDVLTLSATPIPRTLNMALSGIRDMSTLEEPPSDRLPVQTVVIEHDWSVLFDAIRREVSRGGQVYYLYNKVETIARTAAKLQKMDENLRIEVAHGKMTEDELSGVMQRMSEGEIDVLVCTTIIETGLDIPNVNTLIIEDADKLGLAQLHQLRGRVGRSSRRAYAYLTYRPGKALSETATRRLEAISEFAQFGSGFKIAMRDLEIRGAGNVLGGEQSGHMMTVGYDMYLKLLEEAVLEQQGKPAVRPADCSADIAVSANIPEKYIPDGRQRMDFYRKIAAIRTADDADDLIDELADRYGDIPRSVNALISIALLRSNAARAGFTEIVQKNGLLIFKMGRLELKAVSAVCGADTFRGRIMFSAGDAPCITVRLKPGDSSLRWAEKVVEAYLEELKDENDETK
ncbi:MAG: transcription-repair coupling factor [Oscillospiraceae bacterium]|nr:transcription-repair coupling factor [Oscillospiraceae bacterium]